MESIKILRSVKMLKDSGEFAKKMEWDKWVKEIPYIHFPKNWKVQIIPPFHGAIVRFTVKKLRSKKKSYVSVYLDCYDILGSFGEPYWEVYPCFGDVARCKMNDIKSLLNYIEKGLEEYNGEGSQG